MKNLLDIVGSGKEKENQMKIALELISVSAKKFNTANNSSDDRLPDLNTLVGQDTDKIINLIGLKKIGQLVKILENASLRFEITNKKDKTTTESNESLTEEEYQNIIQIADDKERVSHLLGLSAGKLIDYISKTQTQDVDGKPIRESSAIERVIRQAKLIPKRDISLNVFNKKSKIDFTSGNEMIYVDALISYLKTKIPGIQSGFFFNREGGISTDKANSWLRDNIFLLLAVWMILPYVLPNDSKMSMNVAINGIAAKPETVESIDRRMAVQTSIKNFLENNKIEGVKVPLGGQYDVAMWINTDKISPEELKKTLIFLNLKQYTVISGDSAVENGVVYTVILVSDKKDNK